MDRIKKYIDLCNPEEVQVITQENQLKELKNFVIKTGLARRLSVPDSLWFCSNPHDVARSEEATVVASDRDLGPYIKTVPVNEARCLVKELFENSMASRVAYIVPYVMGSLDSDIKKFGVTLTDSPYVVLNMAILNKVTDEALKSLDSAVIGVHSMASMDPTKKKIIHFIEDLEVFSVNTNYGGNVLTGKKCFSLRIASSLGRAQGWLAEHMLVSVVHNPICGRFVFTAALPSACGKTNLAMMNPSEEYARKGWSVTCGGDDIAWIFPKAGRLFAYNPEYGFFGVAPGTSESSNPNFMSAILKGGCIFTNTAVDEELNLPWWEGIGKPYPHKIRTWRNEVIINPNKEEGPFAHPNSRVTVPIENCPVLDPLWRSSEGFEIDAILFGCRRAAGYPLVFKARNWAEAVYFAATLKSERTSAQEGTVGVLRHDPFAMRPFFSYHIGDYLRHWLTIGESLSPQPSVYFVNWFRKDSNSMFVWPGFGENIRVLEWVIKTTKGVSTACIDSLYGLIPARDDLSLPEGVLYEHLFTIDVDDFEKELEENEHFLKALGSKCPEELWSVHESLKAMCKKVL